jgi:hypothetical protein
MRIFFVKTVLKVAAIAFLFASASAFAHHPAADMVDPETFEMIDENVEDTPHGGDTTDDMGGSGGNGR